MMRPQHDDTSRAELLAWLGDPELSLVDDEDNPIPATLVADDEDALARMAVAWRRRDEVYPDVLGHVGAMRARHIARDSVPEISGIHECPHYDRHAVITRLRTHYLLGAAAHTIGRLNPAHLVYHDLAHRPRDQALEEVVARVRGAITVAEQGHDLAELWFDLGRRARRSLYCETARDPLAPLMHQTWSTAGVGLVRTVLSPTVQQILMRQYTTYARHHRQLLRLTGIRSSVHTSDPQIVAAARTRAATLHQVLVGSLHEVVQTLTGAMPTLETADKIDAHIAEYDDLGASAQVFIDQLVPVLQRVLITTYGSPDDNGEED